MLELWADEAAAEQINTKYCYKGLELCPNRGKAGQMGREEEGAKGGSANSNHKFGTPLQSEMGVFVFVYLWNQMEMLKNL